MPQAAFQRMNEEREREGLPPAVNPRNAAAGTLRTLEPSIVANRRLVFFAYFLLVDGEYSPRANGHARCAHRSRLPRESAPRPRGLGRRDDEVHRRCGEPRATLGYEIDGVVLKVDRTLRSSAWATPAARRAGRLRTSSPRKRAITQVKDILIT